MTALRHGEPLLIVSHTFPPYRGIGGRRWAKMAKELARRGHPVHVVQADQGDELKGSLWDADLAHPLIHRHALPMRYPAVLMKRPLTSPLEKIAYRFWLKVLPLIAKGNVFDRSVRWGPVLLPTCKELIAQHGIRHVIATAPPFALLHQLLALKGSAAQLVADFRDPWTWGEVYGRSSMNADQRNAEDRLEADVMAGYDRITTPSPFILAHLQRAYPQHATKLSLLEHIIDPDELGTPAPRIPPGVHRDGPFRMIYAGSIYNTPGFTAYFAEVLKAFVALKEQRAERWAHTVFDLCITGHGTTEFEAMARTAGQAERINFHEPMPGARLFPLIAKADLVLAYMPPEKKDFVSTKFNEIAFLGTPILHVGEPGGLSQHIVANGLGSTTTVETVHRTLLSVLDGTTMVKADAAFTATPFLLANVADKLVSEVLGAA